MGNSKFEELKRAALQESSRQREELHEKIQRRTQEKNEAQRAANERLQQRAAWVAREKQRQAQRQALEEKAKKEQEAQAAKRLAAAKVAEKAAVDKARGRPPRAKALDHAHTEAVKHRLQVPRVSSSVALTREEKRMKRMAKEMGVKFRPESKTQLRRPASTAKEPGTSTASVSTKRPMTPRERFIMEEHKRKEARKAAQPSSPDASESYDSDQSAGASDDAISHASIRDQIWQMFGRDRQRYIARDVDSDEDDMEAGASAVLQEEQRSSLYGRREDEREERLLNELKRQKMQNTKP
ncbi:hypothetical protein MEQU1_002078 [Malassezia equina]|uniref:SPT2 chromatin protein n=1 Tax=Malassezia equina TaxID=1381935 RepID=A0AAF0EDT1_9BASI|nr:hypothetical protein MEQU1_002078 [Malassezia equina]